MYYLHNVFEQVPYTTGTILKKKKMTLSNSPFTPMYIRTSIALKTTMVVGPLQKRQHLEMGQVTMTLKDYQQLSLCASTHLVSDSRSLKLR